MNQELDPEFNTLLQKYAGGNIPPLINIENSELGLINKDILEKYHRGTMVLSKLPLGILIAAEWFDTIENKWLWGDFTLNEWARSHWPTYCKALRETKAGNLICEECDRRRAVIAEQNGSAIAYLCDNGLIDFAVPIKVYDQVVAILFCGQYQPKKESRWNPEIIQSDGIFIEQEQAKGGANAWQESRKRIKTVSKKVNLSEEHLLNLLSDNENPVQEISPPKIVEVQQQINRIANELSSLATSTYELEKGRVVNSIRNAIAQSLQPLSDKSEENTIVWQGLANGLNYLIKFFHHDYAAIISSCKNKENQIRVLCHTGKPLEDIRIGMKFSVKEEDLSDLRSICAAGEINTIETQKYKDVAFFDLLYNLHKGKKIKDILAIPIPGPPGVEPSLLLLGSFDNDVKNDNYYDVDRDYLELFTSDIRLVVQTVLLIDRLEEEAHKRDLFVEDIGHDIRNPIQNMLVTSGVLTSDSLNIDILRDAAKRLAAQVRHLNNISQRVRTLSNIDSGIITSVEAEYVVVYQTLTEIRKTLSALANERDIEIQIDNEMQGWQRIMVNKSLFWNAVLNLTENALKYSKKSTEIRIDGKRLLDGVSISWVDRGIPILEEDKEKIFERYFRAKTAVQHTQVGRGIGLFIVKTFIEDCKGNIEVKSLPIKGTKDYVTEFKLFIPTRRW